VSRNNHENISDEYTNSVSSFVFFRLQRGGATEP